MARGLGIARAGVFVPRKQTTRWDSLGLCACLWETSANLSQDLDPEDL